MKDRIVRVEFVGLFERKLKFWSVSNLISTVDRLLTKGNTYIYTHFLIVLITEYTTVVVDLAKTNGEAFQPTINYLGSEVRVNSMTRLPDYIDTFYPGLAHHLITFVVPDENQQAFINRYMLNMHQTLPSVTSDYFQWFYNRLWRNNAPSNNCMFPLVHFLIKVMNYRQFRYTMTPSELTAALYNL